MSGVWLAVWRGEEGYNTDFSFRQILQRSLICMYAFIFFLQTLTENLSSLCVSDQCSTLHCKCNFCHSPRLFFFKAQNNCFFPSSKAFWRMFTQLQRKRYLLFVPKSFSTKHNKTVRISSAHPLWRGLFFCLNPAASFFLFALAQAGEGRKCCSKLILYVPARGVKKASSPSTWAREGPSSE